MSHVCYGQRISPSLRIVRARGFHAVTSPVWRHSTALARALWPASTFSRCGFQSSAFLLLPITHSSLPSSSATSPSLGQKSTPQPELDVSSAPPTAGGQKSLHDEEIASVSIWIQLVNPRAESSPSESRLLAPARLSDVLRRIDRRKHCVVLVSSDIQPPVCKLFAKSALHEAEKQAKKNARVAAKRSSGQAKEVQLTWATTLNDVQHKLRMVPKALADGLKVKVVIATSPGRAGERSKGMTGEAKKALVNEVEERMIAIGGVKGKEEFEGVGVRKMTQEWSKPR